MDEQDKTIPPRRQPSAVPVDDEATIPGRRARKATGEISVGDVIQNRYRVVSELGRGGMGVVYRCYDTVNRMDVAMKTLPPELSGSAEEMEEIRDNFAVAGRLAHPNIATMRTLETEAGRYFLMMDFVDGVSLKTWVRRHRANGTWNEAEFFNLIRQAAAALDYAHSENVIHRDIKPANIMVNTSGRVKLLDFGLAAQIRNSMTHVSMVQQDTSGTVPYMAPEQWRGLRQYPATDQYALAVTVYEILAERLPFESSDKDIMRTCVLTEKPENIENVSPFVNNALQKALAKDPKDRFASCSEFATALQIEGTPKTDKVDKKTAPETLRKNILIKSLVSPVLAWIADNKIKTLLSALALLLICGICTFLYIQNKQKVSVDLSGNDYTLTLPGNIKLEMVRVEAGTFTMGIRDSESFDNEKEHSVTLKNDFWIGKTEVTQAQWKAVMGDNPSWYPHWYWWEPWTWAWSWKVSKLPVENVNWNDCKEFCAKLNKLCAGKLPEGYRFDLPTEAQWEYAARGGKKSRGFQYSGSNDIYRVAWYSSNSGSKTHPVGEKEPNEIGLYDMSGNVDEWCRDRYDRDEKGYASDPEFLSGNTGSYRVYRGGNWNSARRCRSSGRHDSDPTYRRYYLGLRLALVRVQ